jgi:hypothetical protein
MNTTKYNNKELSVALTLVATISVMFVAPNALANPVFALGHWHEGDDMNGNSDKEDQIKDCLNTVNSSTHKEDKEDHIKDCFNSVNSKEEDEKDNDNDVVTTVSDDENEDDE